LTLDPAHMLFMSAEGGGSDNLTSAGKGEKNSDTSTIDHVSRGVWLLGHGDGIETIGLLFLIQQNDQKIHSGSSEKSIQGSV
jgi:hypothetical protein